MSRSDGRFDFKRFSVAHSRSTMKVGVDGVLIGLWSQIPLSGRILEVGTGCGIISLICAQRSESSQIIAIDKDKPSVDEAATNFIESPWSDRLHAEWTDFNDFVSYETGRFDLVISNPPFFDSGVDSESSRRLTARHQGSLSPSRLLLMAPSLLNDDGLLAMIVPADMVESLEEESKSFGICLRRITLVSGHEGAPIKRALLEFSLRREKKEECFRDILTLESAPGVPTDAYRMLGKDFYLKF